ncbi:MAG TPA: FkbM family methyltransferase [Gemmatimonadaceae bacterium]|nr:FkbM family methyltransferase [Gemmatimonadaceae bacterium]
MSAISFLRRLVDRAPIVARSYRNFRDRRATRRLSRAVSPYGFALWGGNYLASGIHESDELDLVARELRSADVLVDCGANGGLFTCLAASQRVHAIAIEPLPSNLAVLYRNLHENDFPGPVEVYPVAVGARAGIATLYGRGQGASLVAGWGGQPTYDGVTVPVLPLDSILGQRFDGARILLKVDVEGAEWEMLRGAEHTVAQRPKVLMELSLSRNHPQGHNRNFRAVFEHFWNLGYSAHAPSRLRESITAERVDAWLERGRTELAGENFWFSPNGC